MSKKRITRISAVEARRTKGRTDWKRVRRLTERDIARAAAGDPDAAMTTAADWANARVVWPRGKSPVTLRLDNDVLEWFRKKGRGYQTRINAVLRAFIDAKSAQR
ncbi:MAG TPA: BrnA antitoxin family protein [Alphaproteobacteria bacterium]|nr:BrnA antitoxin family protein [Alphaproteobacteria bacterium]